MIPITSRNPTFRSWRIVQYIFLVSSFEKRRGETKDQVYFVAEAQNCESF